MEEKILEMLRESDEYVSGEKMSKKLNISRAAIWKHINNLREIGYDIKSVTNHGYHLMRESPDTLIGAEIYQYLKTDFIARNVEYYEKTDSTNTRAKKNHDMPDGTLFIAEIQREGRGRQQKEWLSPKETGIWMSLLLKPNTEPASISAITLIAGLAVCKGLPCEAKIKWPNDVIIGTKKVAGILTEMSAEADAVHYVVCGIGINVNMTAFTGELEDKATSIYIETGKTFKRARIVACIMNEFETLYKDFLEHGLTNIINDYKENCATIGREIRVIYNNREITGTAVSVDNDGSLIVDSGGEQIKVRSGEVSVRGIYGYV